jgi:type VI protein secretion system component VasK
MTAVMMVMRWVLAGMWLVLSILILLRHWLLPETVYANYDPGLLNMVGIVGFVLAGFNLWRWFRVERNRGKTTDDPIGQLRRRQRDEPPSV